ncbi:MAG TPA: polysaccharide deacetylase family protein [Patescibacteria group bacterium]|nr:polysaccharide deacetylase family protein [Patescibacteria group bacterium]
MPLSRQWKRRLFAAAAILAAPALAFATFDALIAGGDASVSRPALVESLGRASRAVGTVLSGAGERLRGADGPSAPAPAAPPTEPSSTRIEALVPERIMVPFLVYHNIEIPDEKVREADRPYYVTPSEFEGQMAALQSSGFVPVSPDDVAAALRGEKPLPAKPVVITFDDDRESQFENAFPALLRHRMTATFYVFTNAIGRKGYLSWDQLRTLRDAGMGIQSHTIFHPFLEKLGDEEMRKEIEDSRAVLEKELGISVTSFAYPFGTHDDRVVAAVRAAGYATARTLRHAPDVGLDDLFLLPGYIVTGDRAAFAKILAGAWR